MIEQVCVCVAQTVFFVYAANSPAVPYVSYSEDQQFNDEKTYLIKQIRDMVPATLAGAGV